MAEQGIFVDHSILYRRGIRLVRFLTGLPAGTTGGCWRMDEMYIDETYIKVEGQ